MTKLTRMLAGLLSFTARMLPADRQQRAEAVQSEAESVPAGWPRLRWLAGGVRMMAPEALVIRKFAYWLGLGAVAAVAAWTVWGCCPGSAGRPDRLPGNTPPSARRSRLRVVLVVDGDLATLPSRADGGPAACPRRRLPVAFCPLMSG